MGNSIIDAVIDFAIDEERNACKLYSSAAKKAVNGKLTALLSDMAKMERGHAAKLQAFKEGRIEEIGREKVKDLKIGDYLVDVEIDEESSIQDIMIFAIKSEMKARSLYMKLSDLFNGKDEKALFSKLANEELRHKNHLEEAYSEEVYKEISNSM